MVQMESLSDQAHVLVDPQNLAGRTAPDLDVLLADGLDEADPGEALLQAGDDGQRRAGLADVLLGGGDEYRALVAAVGQARPVLAVGIVGVGIDARG